MKKRMIKILSTFMLAVMMMSLCNTVMAMAKDSGNWLTHTYTGNYDSSAKPAVNKLREIMGNGLSAVRIVAIGVAMIMISYLGIKYMSAAPNEKAVIKNKLMMLTLGVVVAVGAVKIFEFIQNYAGALKE